MKLRLGFVSNSSSSSFFLNVTKLELRAIKIKNLKTKINEIKTRVCK